MSRNSKPYVVDKIPAHHTSAKLQHEFKFNMYQCAVHRNGGNRIEATCLIIGYDVMVNREGVKEDVYVVVENAISNQISTKDKIRVNYVSKKYFEDHFIRCGRPAHGILKYPKKGDKVFCVARARYSGTVAGESYTVHGMPDGRVMTKQYSDYTYEPEYFVIIKEGEKNTEMSRWPGTNPSTENFHIGMDTATGSTSIFKTSSPYGGNPIVAVSYEMAPDDYAKAAADILQPGKTIEQIIEDKEREAPAILAKTTIIHKSKAERVEKKKIYQPELLTK